MRRKLIIGLVLLNGLIAPALFVKPAETQIIPLGIFHCCKGGPGERYCCASCCWFTFDCLDDEGCRVT